MMLAVGLVITICIGAILQRVSGMGVGLIGGPVLMLMLGPVEGIMVINVLAAINAAANTIGMRADISWSRFWLIAPVMIIGAVPAAFLISRTETAPLLVIVGAALLVALAVVTWAKRYVPPMSGPGPAISAGILGGFTNTLAGVAGPVITVYAQAARWPHVVYAATLQPIFLVGGLISVSTKAVMGAGTISHVPPELWIAGVLGLGLGIAVGARVAARVDRTRAHRLALVLAAAGAASAMLRGLLSL